MFMIRKTLTQEALEKACVEIEKETGEALGNAADAIGWVNLNLNNESGGSFHLQIKSRLAVEDSAQRVWGLVNTRSDAIAKLSTPFEAWHLHLLKVTLGLIAASEDGYTAHTQVVHAFQSEAKKAADIQATLDRLVAHGWLQAHDSQVNYYTAGQRAMLELSDTMRELGAQECPVAKMPVVRTPKYLAWLAARTIAAPGVAAAVAAAPTAQV
jgi:hypothetical protein